MSGDAAAGLAPFRCRLDAIDEEIARLLGERFEICRAVARYKSAHGIPMMQPGRVDEVRARYLARGAAADLPARFTGELFELLIAATCKEEDKLMAALATAPAFASGPRGRSAPTPGGESEGAR